MADRINLDANPALKNDATNWSGGSRVAVTGFQRPNGYQGSGSTFYHEVAGLTPGSSLLVSFDHKLSSSASPRLTITWNTSGGAYIDFTDVIVGNSLSSGVVRRLEAIVTPPANATNAEFQFKSFPSGSQVTAVLVEHRSDPAPYFDGDSEGAVWNGADGNSPSTLPEEPPYEGPTEWVTEDFEDTNYAFTITGGWARASDSMDTGVYSLKSNNAGQSNTTSEAVVTVPEGALNVRFSYRVSSEADWDWFRFLVDGSQRFEDSGESGWVPAGITYSVVGASQISFRYVKDGNTNEGSDAAWIDNLAFEVPAPTGNSNFLLFF